MALKFDFAGLNAYLHKLQDTGIKPSMSYLRKSKIALELLINKKVPETRPGIHKEYLSRVTLEINKWETTYKNYFE